MIRTPAHKQTDPAKAGGSVNLDKIPFYNPPLFSAQDKVETGNHSPRSIYLNPPVNLESSNVKDFGKWGLKPLEGPGYLTHSSLEYFWSNVSVQAINQGVNQVQIREEITCKIDFEL